MGELQYLYCADRVLSSAVIFHLLQPLVAFQEAVQLYRLNGDDGDSDDDDEYQEGVAN